MNKQPAPQVIQQSSQVPPPQSQNIDLFGDGQQQQPQQAQPQGQLQSQGSLQPQNNPQLQPGANNSMQTCKNIKIPFNEIVSENQPGIDQKNSGLKIEAVCQREGENMLLYLRLKNCAQIPISNFAIRLDNNSYRLAAEPTVSDKVF